MRPQPSRMLVDVGLRREDAEVPPGRCFIAVIDVLRATSTIVTALASGATAVLPVDTVDEALALRQADAARVLAGERGAHPIPGFDFGNSPAAMLDLRVTGREVVLATTNGSRALAWAVRQSSLVAALALLNVGAVAAAIRAQPPESVYLLCSGTEGRFSLDDAFVAGAAVAALQLGGDGDGLALTDAAQAVLALYRSAPDRPYGVLAAATAGQNLLRKGYRADVEFCARQDVFDVVPLWRDHALRRA